MIETKYGQIRLEGKETADDEPCFLLRAQDRLAVKAVLYYAMLRDLEGDRVGAEAVRYAAQRMEEWPIKKTPD